MHSQEPGSEAHYSDALAIKAIVPEKVQHDGKEQIAIIFNHRLNLKTKEQFFVDFVGTAGAVQVTATLANSSTLMLETPVYKQPSVVTAYVYHGIHRRLLGQHRFEFLSRNDTFYRLLYGALDPINFMCEALGMTSGDMHDLDNTLAETFVANAPEGFDFLGHHRQGTDQSSAEYPTLLHFASNFGLRKLIEVILRYPGAYEACSMKNYHGQWPYNIAENYGFHELANDLRAFHDQGDPSGYIKMEKEGEDVYVKMQKADGSYCYVLRKEGNELYTAVNNKDEQEECYVKMVKAGGGYYYMPMKPGVGPKQSGDVNKKQYINVQEQDESEAYQEDFYENVNKPIAELSNVDQDGQEIYEDMERDGNEPGVPEELYVDMKPDGNPTADGHDEEFYMAMNRKGNETTDEFYTDIRPAEEAPSDLYMPMVQEQTPDKFGYVTPNSNRPVTSDAVLFNRSASSAAEVRARQLGNIQRQTQSLPAGASLSDALQNAFQQGKLSDKEASEFITLMGKLGISDRRGSTTSKGSTSTTSSTGSSGSSGISISSESERIMPHEEVIEDAENEEEEEEAIHASRNDILSQIKSSKNVPPPLPQPDYHRKEKTTGSANTRQWQSKTTPVEEKDLQGIFNAQPPPFQRRKSTPLGAGSNIQEPSSERQLPSRHRQPIPESAPPRTAPRPAPRPPVSPPSDTTSTRTPAPIPPSERMRQSGVQVLPIPTARDTPPHQQPRKSQPPLPQRSPRKT